MHASNPSAAPTAPISQVIKPNGLAKELKVIKRTGQTTPFDLNKIKTAITKAFLAVEGEYASGSQVLNKLVEQLTQTVMNALLKHTSPANALHIENIQDQVELALMRGGHHQVPTFFTEPSARANESPVKRTAAQRGSKLLPRRAEKRRCPTHKYRRGLIKLVPTYRMLTAPPFTLR